MAYTIVNLWILQSAFVGFAVLKVAHVSESSEDLHSFLILFLFLVQLEVSTKSAAAEEECQLNNGKNQESSAFITHVNRISPFFKLSVWWGAIFFNIPVFLRKNTIKSSFWDIPVVFHSLILLILHGREDQVEIDSYQSGEPAVVATHGLKTHIL